VVREAGRDPGASRSRSTVFPDVVEGRSPESSLRTAGGLSGEPQQVIDRIGEYIDGGAQRVNIAIRPPVDWEALQEYVEDVMPAFR
jgi:alkanesulfonate monooxygenase SsuD/methylene tetrahydromethanopterin reductase-like flavin-dependent oxidoreductase (luciferase family)